MLRNIVQIVASISVLGALSGCRTPQIDSCLESQVNTRLDEIAGCRFDDKLIFLRLASSKAEQIWEISRRQDGSWSKPALSTLLPAVQGQAGKPAIAYLESGRFLMVYPMLRTSSNVDLVECIYEEGHWNEPRWLDELNSPAWDSHPALLYDGTVMVFTSDRPDGRGGKDLYVSSRTSSGWSPPKLIALSTKGDELTPTLLRDTSLLFVRQRDTLHGDRDVYYARSTSVLEWTSSEPLPAPINSQYDELAPVIWDSLIIISSQRSGGQSSYDLYMFQLCGPVYLRGRVYPSPSITFLDGILTVASRQSLMPVNIGVDGTFMIPLTSAEHYILHYTNACSGLSKQWELTTPCNPHQSVILELPIILPDTNTVRDAHAVDAFMDGDYLPTTVEYLTTIDMLRAYNLTAPVVKASSSPSTIRSLLENMVEWMGHALKCAPSSNLIVSIMAAPSKHPVRYRGVTLSDPLLGGRITTGSILSPPAAAMLRAYAMMIQLQEFISRHQQFNYLRERIHWKLGVHESDNDFTSCHIRAGLVPQSY